MYPLARCLIAAIFACLMQGADNMLENFAKPMLNDIRGAVA